MKKRILLALFIFLVIPIMPKAYDASCTSEEKARLFNLVNTIQIIYEFDDQSKTYNMIINGLTRDFYILKSDTNLFVKYTGNSTVSLKGYVPGKTYQFPFYVSQYSVCNDYFVVTKSVYLPAYNQYYEDPLCRGNEAFELCKKFSPIKVSSYEEFKQRLNQYIIDKNKETPKPNEEPPVVEKSIWNKIVDFLLNYNLYFLIPIILFGTTGIVIIEIRRRRNIL